MDDTLLEGLGFDPDDADATDDPLVACQLEILQAIKDAREAGVPFLALEYRLMNVLYGLYGVAIRTDEVTDEDLLGADVDEETLHLVDVVASSRRMREAGVDEETIRENLATAAEVLEDDDRLEAFY